MPSLRPSSPWDRSPFGGSSGDGQNQDPFAWFVAGLFAGPDDFRGHGKGPDNGHGGGQGQGQGNQDRSASGSMNGLSWTYSADGGLVLKAQAGFLATATGNGGFVLKVDGNGHWELDFTGSRTEIGSDQRGCGAGTSPSSSAGNTQVGIMNGTSVVYNGSAGHQTIDGTLPSATATNPVPGNDTIYGGVGDTMIGGSLPHQVTVAGNIGNCAIYTTASQSSVPAGSVLIDMQNGRGYGSNAEGNTFVNINQVRGSLQSNVLIGASTGTDLKSGGDNSVLISTGGSDFELRPDGTGNVLVSTTGNDRVLFDPTHGWALGDTTTMLGFRAGNLAYLDLRLLGSDFHSPTAMGYNPVTGTGDINDYVKLIDDSSGEHVMFSAAGQVATAGVDIVDLALTHGMTAQGLYASGGIVV